MFGHGRCKMEEQAEEQVCDREAKEQGELEYSGVACNSTVREGVGRLSVYPAIMTTMNDDYSD